MLPKSYRLRMIGRQADVREAAEQDFSKIWDIYRKVVDEGIYTPSVRGQVSPDKCESPGLSEDSEAGSMTLLCEVDSKVVGYASIEETIWEQSRHVCELGIAILPEFRGMGVGSALLDSLINFAFKKGYEKITLSVFHTNKNAIGLYRKFGFKKVGEKKRQFNLKGQYVDEIIMEKFVNSR